MTTATWGPEDSVARGRRRCLAGMAALCAAAWVIGAGDAAALEDLARKTSIKAAYLYKFLPYVQWPDAAFAGPDAPLVIGVLEDEALAAELLSLVAGKQVGARSVIVRRLTEPDRAADVHVLFVGRGGPANRAVAAAAGRPTLVVTDERLVPGTMLNFVQVDGRIRFEAVPAAAERAGLRLGGRLLGVAERVVGDISRGSLP